MLTTIYIRNCFAWLGKIQALCRWVYCICLLPVLIHIWSMDATSSPGLFPFHPFFKGKALGTRLKMSVNWSNWGKWLIEKVNKWSFSSKLSSLLQLSFEIFYRFSVILLALVTVISNKSWRHLFEFSPHYRRFTSQARRTRESPVEERRKIKLYVFFSPGLPLRAKCLVRLSLSIRPS